MIGSPGVTPAQPNGPPRPFFIVGCGRSGTTFLRSLLIRHPKIAVPLESLFIVDYLRVSDRIELKQLKQWVVEEPELREWGLEVAPGDIEEAASMADVIRRLHELYAQKQGKEVWGQKTPRLIRHLDLMHRNFPEAVFIHLVRDPRAVVSSLMRSDVHRSTALHGTRRWLNDVRLGVRFEQRQPEIVLRLSYEELVRAPEDSLRAIMAHIGLDYPERILARRSDSLEDYSEFYENIHANLDKPPMVQNIDKWQEHLSPSEVQLIEGLNWDLMRELGYEPLADQPAVPTQQALWSQVVRPVRLIGQLWRYVRLRRAYLSHLLRRKIRMGLINEFLHEIHR